MDDSAESVKMNGEFSSSADGGVDDGVTKVKLHHRDGDETLYGVLQTLISTIFFPDRDSDAASAPLATRVKISVSENGPRLRDASKSAGRDVLLWTRRGSPLRAVLVISVSNQSFD